MENEPEVTPEQPGIPDEERKLFAEIAYAVLGAGEAAVDALRKLSERSDDTVGPTEMEEPTLNEGDKEAVAALHESGERVRHALEELFDALGERARETAGEAEKELEVFAERGREIVARLSEREDVQTAFTSVRDGAETAVSRIRTVSGGKPSSTKDDAPLDLTFCSKAELYDVATDRGVQGREEMNREELLAALQTTGTDEVAES